MVERDITGFIPKMVTDTVYMLVLYSRRHDRLVSRSKLKKWGYIRHRKRTK